MEWLNITVKTLRSDEYLGSDPVERATWLNLMAYCADQENGGVIEDCADWKDRRWQQIVRVTKKEAEAVCDLWEWRDGSIHVLFYPTDKEAEIRSKREVARTNGQRGGRPIKVQNPDPEKTNVGTNKKPTSVNSAKAERKGIGIGMEGNGIGERARGASSSDCFILPTTREDRLRPQDRRAAPQRR